MSKIIKSITLISIISVVPVCGQLDVISTQSDTMIVTATRSQKAVRDISASVNIVTQEDIEASNAHSCTDVLNTLPGVFINKTGAYGRADVDIRGLGDRGRNIMVLVDGRPVKMGIFGCTITHSLPLDNIERVEVVRGPASVLYGSDAMGGVLNIITRKAEKNIQADMTAAYGTDNSQQYRLQTGGNVKNINYFITGDLQKSDGHVANSAYNGKDMTCRVGYKYSDNYEVTLTGKYFDGRKEEPALAGAAVPSEAWSD
ncbi:MAG: TonB-dependent receptor plug domain-containing protein, partial [bacterium]